MAETSGNHGRPRSAAFAQLSSAIEELLPLIEAEADSAERQYRQSDRVVGALRQSGIYAMLLPKALGGGELSFTEAMEIIARLSWADASAGCMDTVPVESAKSVDQGSKGGFAFIDVEISLGRPRTICRQLRGRRGR